jgi:hypothetical protein
VFTKGVFRIDLHQLAPDPTGFLGLAQMAERDGEESAREIGLRIEPDSLWGAVPNPTEARRREVPRCRLRLAPYRGDSAGSGAMPRS